MVPKKGVKEVKFIIDENLEEIYGVKFSKLTYNPAYGNNYDLIRFRCEISVPTKKIKDTIFFSVASVDSDDRIMSSSVIEIDFKKFHTTALIDTCLCASKDIVSLNLYFTRFRPH